MGCLNAHYSPSQNNIRLFQINPSAPSRVGEGSGLLSAWMGSIIAPFDGPQMRFLDGGGATERIE